MKQYRFEAEPAVELDIESAFDWYDTEESGLGREFLDQLRAAYRRVPENPFAFQILRHGIRRALTRRFPYAIYYTLEEDTIHPGGYALREGPGRMATTNLVLY